MLVLAPLSRLAFIIGAWLVLEWISKSSEFAGVGCAVEVGFIIRAWLVLGWISKSSEFAGVGSAVIFSFPSGAQPPRRPQPRASCASTTGPGAPRASKLKNTCRSIFHFFFRKYFFLFPLGLPLFSLVSRHSLLQVSDPVFQCLRRRQAAAARRLLFSLDWVHQHGWAARRRGHRQQG